MYNRKLLSDEILAACYEKLEGILDMKKLPNSDEFDINSGLSNQKLYSLFSILILANGYNLKALSLFNPKNQKEDSAIPIVFDLDEYGNIINVEKVAGESIVKINDIYDREFATITFLNKSLTITLPGREDGEISKCIPEPLYDKEIILNCNKIDVEDYSFIAMFGESLSKQYLLENLIKPLIRNLIYTAVLNNRNINKEVIDYILDFNINDESLRQNLFDLIKSNTFSELDFNSLVSGELMKVLNENVGIEEKLNIAINTQSQVVLMKIFDMYRDELYKKMSLNRYFKETLEARLAEFLKNPELDSAAISCISFFALKQKNTELIKSVLNKPNIDCDTVASIAEDETMMANQEIVKKIEEKFKEFLGNPELDYYTIIPIAENEIMMENQEIAGKVEERLKGFLRNPNIDSELIGHISFFALKQENTELIKSALNKPNIGFDTLVYITRNETMMENQEIAGKVEEKFKEFLGNSELDSVAISRISFFALEQKNIELIKSVLNNPNIGRGTIVSIANTDIAKSDKEIIDLILVNRKTPSSIKDDLSYSVLDAGPIAPSSDKLSAEELNKKIPAKTNDKKSHVEILQNKSRNQQSYIKTI